MKLRLIFIVLLLLTILGIEAQTKSKKEYTIFLTGASFASPNNGWFELACESLNATPINRAVPATSIRDAANLLSSSKLYTREELDNIDALVIMHVHDQDVANETGFRKKYLEYTTAFEKQSYAVAYDYIIKRYISECYNLRLRKDSKYYGTPNGKPAIIVLCTHWHDGRTIYNSSIRRLAEKWGLPLVEFDKNIGFTKNNLHPVTGKQYSIIYAHNNEKINGVEYGWHPYEGQNQFIQQRMAAIFADVMKKVLPLK